LGGEDGHGVGVRLLSRGSWRPRMGKESVVLQVNNSRNDLESFWRCVLV
jgi:hypothetical protein